MSVIVRLGSLSLVYGIYQLFGFGSLESLVQGLGLRALGLMMVDDDDTVWYAVMMRSIFTTATAAKGSGCKAAITSNYIT